MITYELMKPVDGQTDSVQHHGLWILLVYVWLIMLTTFSATGREGPSSVESLDLIALIKVAARISGLSVLGIMIVRSWHHPRRRVVARCLLPLGLYVGWAIVSTFWSPLKAVSLGQAVGLMVQVMLAFVVALRCTDLRDGSKILYHLSMAMLVFSAGVLIAHAISPETSGLIEWHTLTWEEGASGLVHPTAAGATASLGILMIVSAMLLWNWRWSRVLLMPALLIHGVLLVLAMRRIPIIVGAATVLLSFLLFSRRIVTSGVSVMVCIFMAGYIALDPGLELADRTFGSALGYARRGETDDQTQSINGRTLLWEAVWDEFKKSPVIGHGYFVSSKLGEIDVWDGPSNKTAHNVLLQVLVSTGVIGAILFIWGLIQPAAACSKFLLGDSRSRKLAAFLGVVGIWYFGWGLFCESFMGPVQPESVVFFTLLGMAIGIFSSGRQTL